MNHVVVGAALPFVVSAILYARRGYRASLAMLVVAPMAMGLCGLWAVVPDIPRAAGHLDLYHSLHRDPRCDVFFFHYTIDERLEGSMVPYSIGFVVIGVSLLFAAWRELHLRTS